MGMFSYNCKECGHPLLSGHATDAGINEWMSEAVVLTPRGGRFIGTYDGYGRVGGCEDLDNAACLHEACWEEAGRPEWGRYGSVSDHAADQGFFFDDGAHDMIDPRIKEGRDELLAAGVAARTERRHDERAHRVREWVRDEPMDDRPRWRQRFRYGPLYEDGKPIDGRWYISDDLGTSDRHDFPGTEAEVAAECARLWDEFTSGEECAALLARAEKPGTGHLWRKVQGQKPGSEEWIWTKEWHCKRCGTVAWDCKRPSAPSCEEVQVEDVMES